jgi:hypothetical protein
VSEFTLNDQDANRANRREVKIMDQPVTMFGPPLTGAPILAILLTTSDSIDAEFKADWLGSNGIPCIVTGTYSARIFGNLIDSMKVNVLVPELLIKEAEQLLEVLAVGDNLSLVEYGYSEE